MATFTATGVGGNWTDAILWSGVGTPPPTADDDAKLDAGSGNVTIGAGAVCRSLDCTGYTGTLTHTAGVTLAIGGSTAGAGNNALKLVAGMTYTKGNATSSAVSFVSTSATQQSITLGGKTLGDVTFNGIGGSWAFADAFATAGAFTYTAGAIAFNGQTCSCVSFVSSSNDVRTIDISTANWTISGSSGTIFSHAGSNSSISSGGGAILLTDAGASDKTFTSNVSVNSTPITITAGGAGAVIFSALGSATGLLTINAPKTVKFLQSATSFVAGFVATGSVGNVITIDSTDGISAFTLSCPVQVSCDYLNLTRSTAADNIPFYAGANSTNGGSNTNWTFGAPGVPGSCNIRRSG